MKTKLMVILAVIVAACEVSESGEEACTGVYTGRIVFNSCNTVIQVLSGNQCLNSSTWVNSKNGRTYKNVIRRLNDCRLEINNWDVGDEIYFRIEASGLTCDWCNDNNAILPPTNGYVIDWIERIR